MPQVTLALWLLGAANIVMFVLFAAWAISFANQLAEVEAHAVAIEDNNNALLRLLQLQVNLNRETEKRFYYVEAKLDEQLLKRLDEIYTEVK